MSSQYVAAASPDEAAIKAYYDLHKAEYMTPETVNLRYLEISLAQLASQVTVNDAQLRAYYEEQKAKTPERYTQAERRRVRHILLQVTDPKDDAAVKLKADAILKRAQGGEDFSKLAKEFSQDPGSAEQGGDLGWSERKVWVAPFADAAYSMKEGEIRGPVKTQFGYHILKLDGIQPAAGKSFDQSRKLAQADNFSGGQIGDMCFASERKQMVLAQRMKFDIAQQNHFIVALVKHCLEMPAWVFL